MYASCMALPMTPITQTLDPTLTLGERIAKARKDAGLDQQGLANMLGVSRPLVSKWERGKSIPDIVQSARLAEYTHVPLGWLAGVDARSRCSPALSLVSDVGQMMIPFDTGVRPELVR